jgi:hypothetical protein
MKRRPLFALLSKEMNRTRKEKESIRESERRGRRRGKFSFCLE